MENNRSVGTIKRPGFYFVFNCSLIKFKKLPFTDLGPLDNVEILCLLCKDN